MNYDKFAAEYKEVAIAIQQILSTTNLRNFESVAKVLYEKWAKNYILTDEPYDKWKMLYRIRLRAVWNTMADYYNLEEVSKDEAQKIYNKLEQRSKVRVKTIRWIIFFVWLIIIIWALSSSNGNHSTDIHGLLWDMN